MSYLKSKYGRRTGRTEFEFVGLADFNVSDEITFDDVDIFTTRYGDSPVLVSSKNKKFIRCPRYMADTFRELLADDRAMEIIHNGASAVVIEYNKDGHAFRTIDFK